jgi:sulfhydrogenase subunit beta (sulfur reductase)
MTNDWFLPHARLQDLLTAIIDLGYRIIGPQVQNGAIVYQQLTDARQLPWGMQDAQQPGHYRLQETGQRQAFAFANGPQGIKPQLFKSQESLWRVTRDEQGKLAFESLPPKTDPIALFAVKPCDIRAMHIQDKVFVSGKYADTHYRQRRNNVFIIAANCTYSSANCFCVSAGGAPEAQAGYDMAFTEIDDGLVIHGGSEPGRQLLLGLQLSVATEPQLQTARRRVQQAADRQSKQLPLPNDGPLRDLLFANLDHPRWDEVAERCLSCANCTSVCPTCFCANVDSKTALDNQSSEQVREWGSCFTKEHSYIVGKTIRPDTKTRYRQWLTHKVGSWHDQYDTSGCVGCGRCVTWCPVGIDITEELTAIADNPVADDA